MIKIFELFCVYVFMFIIVSAVCVCKIKMCSVARRWVSLKKHNGEIFPQSSFSCKFVKIQAGN